MGGSQGSVVSVRAKMPSVVGSITSNDMSFRPSCFETIVFHYFRSDASLDKFIDPSNQRRIIDNVIPPTLEGMICEKDRFASYLAHHSELPAPVIFITLDKLTAKLWSEHVRQIKYWGLEFDARKIVGWWKVGQIAEQSSGVAAVVCKGDDLPHTQCRI
jgi:hypothetical protein